MATTRVMPLHIGKGRAESQAISDIIDYVANPQKTAGGRLITGFACDSRVSDAEFLLAKREYISTTGRVRGTDDVLACHVRQSFAPGEITPEEAGRLGVEFASRFRTNSRPGKALSVCNNAIQNRNDEVLREILKKFSLFLNTWKFGKGQIKTKYLWIARKFIMR